MESSFIEVDWIKRWSTDSPKREAFYDVPSGHRYTYAEVFQIVNGLAIHLKKQGVKFGDRVAVLSPNKIEMIFLFFALQRLGALLVPINFRLSAEEVDYILKDSGAQILFSCNELKKVTDKLHVPVQKQSLLQLGQVCSGFLQQSFGEEVELNVEPETPVMILYTSGTTGFPKGVVITHKLLFWNSVNTSFSLDISSNDCMVSFLPLFHTGGWNVLLTPFVHRGAKTVFLQQFDADQVLQYCESEKATLLFGVPTTLALMVKSKSFESVNLESIRYAIVGGEPMPLNLIQTWHAKGVSVRQGFGLTECGPNCFSLSEKDAESKIGSIGRPNFYVRTKIVDENDHEVKPGEVGELLLKGPMCMQEYWQNPEATEKSFLGKWLRTGDLVKKDKDEYYFVVGRKKEMFISGGENVYPAEVEKVLSQHQEVEEVAVVGWPDSQWGEVGKAFVVKKSGSSLSDSDIQQFCLERLAKFKIPKHIEWLESLPKGATGKILKKQLQPQAL